MKMTTTNLKVFGLMFLITAFVAAMVLLPFVAFANESVSNSWNSWNNNNWNRWNRGHSWSPWNRSNLFGSNNNLANLIVLSSLFGNSGNLFGSGYGYGGSIFNPGYGYGWGNNLGNLLILDQLFGGNRLFR